MDATSLITPRRNFLVRALGFTVAGATLSVPIVTVASPEERARLHYAELAKALDELAIGANGWMLQAGRHDAVNSSPVNRWATLNLVRYVPDDKPGYSRLMIERHERCAVRLA